MLSIFKAVFLRNTMTFRPLVSVSASCVRRLHRHASISRMTCFRTSVCALSTTQILSEKKVQSSRVRRSNLTVEKLFQQLAADKLRTKDKRGKLQPVPKNAHVKIDTRTKDIVLVSSPKKAKKAPAKSARKKDSKTKVQKGAIKKARSRKEAVKPLRVLALPEPSSPIKSDENVSVIPESCGKTCERINCFMECLKTPLTIGAIVSSVLVFAYLDLPRML